MKNALPGAIEPESQHGLPARRRQPRPRRVQPHGLRRPIVLTIAPAATPSPCWSASRSACRPAISAAASTRPVVPRQPRAGLPGDPAVLPAGDAGHHGHADPLCAWPGCSSCFRSSSSASLFYTRFKSRPDRSPCGSASRSCSASGSIPGSSSTPIRSASSRSTRTSSTSSWRWCSRRARACSASCAASPWTSRPATMWRRRRRAARARGTSCCGRSCPMRAGR